MKKKSRAGAASGKSKSKVPQVLPAESPPPSKTKPFGRPPIYDNDFHPREYIRLSEDGLPIWCIAAEWRVSRETVHEWEKTHSDFSDAVKIGHQLRLAWWTKTGMESMRMVPGTRPKIVNLGMFIWLSQQICQWSNNQKVEDQRKPEREKSEAEIDAELKRLEHQTEPTQPGFEKKESGTA